MEFWQKNIQENRGSCCSQWVKRSLKFVPTLLPFRWVKSICHVWLICGAAGWPDDPEPVLPALLLGVLTCCLCHLPYRGCSVQDEKRETLVFSFQEDLQLLRDQIARLTILLFPWLKIRQWSRKKYFLKIFCKVSRSPRLDMSGLVPSQRSKVVLHSKRQPR